MASIRYRFKGCTLPMHDGRKLMVDGIAIINGEFEISKGFKAWKIISLSVDGQPALCEDCRRRIKAWLHNSTHSGTIEHAIRRAWKGLQ